MSELLAAERLRSGRNHDNVGDALEGLCQGDDTGGEIPVVVTYEDFHALFLTSALFALVDGDALTILNVNRTP